jgi:hypothetical protein
MMWRDEFQLLRHHGLINRALRRANAPLRCQTGIFLSTQYPDDEQIRRDSKGWPAICDRPKSREETPAM